MGIPFSFSWSKGDFDGDEIYSVTITQVEGDFATLTMDVRNPRVGLLGGNLYGTLSYNGTAIFTGRIVGVPQNLFDEVVTLEFIAKPSDYEGQKFTLAQTLKVAPFWDPVWIQSNVDDPDTVLEARTQLWHIDRVTNAVTISDIIAPEDGVVDVGPDDHFYDAMTISYGQTPLTIIFLEGKVNWDQAGGGTGVDLTRQCVAAFQAAGSPLPAPLICSLTGDGLLSSWPAPGTGVGGGWSSGLDSFAIDTPWVRPAFYRKIYVDNDVFPLPADIPGISTTPPGQFSAGGIIGPGLAGSTWGYPVEWEFPDTGATTALLSGGLPGSLKVFAVVFPVHVLAVNFTVDWTAKRQRSETVALSLKADVQALLTDPGVQSTQKIALSSSAITQPIDPGGKTPLFDLRSPVYFPTARGIQSVEYLLALARAKLLARARCVIIKFGTTWDFAIPWISCRHGVHLVDDRLPGGAADGKVTGYTLSYSTAGIGAEVTISCAIGHGGASAIALPGTPSFVDNYVDDYQTFIGGGVSAVEGQVVYSSLDNVLVGDPAGVDLFNVTADSILQPTPAVNLDTFASITAGTTNVTNLQDTTGLANGETYDISTLPGQTGPIKFTFDGGTGGTLSVASLVTLTGIPVEITRPFSNGFRVTNGVAEQTQLVDIAVMAKPFPDPVSAIKNNPTRVCLDLVPVDGGSFRVEYDIATEIMAVPKQINLE